MSRAKVLKSLVHQGAIYQPGDILEIEDDATAERCLSAGLIESAEAPAPAPAAPKKPAAKKKKAVGK